MTTVNWIVLACLAVLAVIVAALLFFAAKRGYKDEVFTVLYNLVYRAEMHFEGTGRGAEKKAWVIKEIHQRLPVWAKLLISEADIDSLLELAVKKLKEYLSSKASAK